MPAPSYFWPAAAASRRVWSMIFQRQVDRDLVVERQRTDRHAGEARAVLDHRRGHALLQHGDGPR